MNNLSLDETLPDDGLDSQPIETATLRRIAGVILGAVFGVIIFFVLVLVVGMINDSFSAGIPLDTNVAENIWSAVMLVIAIILGIVTALWAVNKRELSRSSETSGN